MLEIIPRTIRSYIYTVILKPRLLKTAANFFISLFIKEQHKIPEGLIALNKKDFIVSGALALGFYEKMEAEFIKTKIKPGLVVIDIGANVGFYTVILARLVGPKGQVISFEPEPENFSFLEKTIKINDFKNVLAYQLAVTDKSGTGKLFLSADNKGDHRLYDPGNFKSQSRIDIPLTTLDDFLTEKDFNRVDLVKMDIQGAEGLVLKGMKNTLRKNKNIKLFLEFWPLGLLKSGANPRLLLKELEELGFKIFKIRENSIGADSVSDYSLLINKCSGEKYANLFCER